MGREALRVSQQYVAQRWSLQSSLHGIRRAAKQEVLDTAELTRRASNPATREARLAPNPTFVTHTNAAIGAKNELLTWPDGGGKAAARMRPAGVRTLVPDLLQHMASLDSGEEQQWDAEGGLAAVTQYFHEQWARPYGRKLPQMVPHAHLAKAFSGAVAARKSWAELEAHLSEMAPAPATSIQDIPDSYQFGPTKHTTTQRFWEQEPFVAEFDSVYVEGPSGVVYDDKHVYVTAHAEHMPLAKDFVGDAGAGAGTHRARELVSVATAVSLVQPRYDNYYHFTTEVLPRMFLLLQHLQGGNTNKRTTKPTTLDRPKFIVPMGPSFIGSYIDLMGVALEDMVVYHPDQTVVKADQLFVADWSMPAGRCVPPPQGVHAELTQKPEEEQTAEVGADGTPTEEAQADFGQLLSQRALADDALLSGDPWLLAAGRERARTGDLEEYARATRHHAEWRAAQNITAAAHWEEFTGNTDRAALSVPAGSSLEAVAAAAAEAAGVLDSPDTDKRDQSYIAPRTLLQQVRKHFTKRLIPAPKRQLALKAKEETEELKAIEGGVKNANKGPQKKRRRKGKKAAAETPRDMLPDHEDTVSTFAGFTSPFLFDNGTVLAYPPIRTVLLLKRQPGAPRAIQNAAAVRSDLVSFFGEAVAAAHGDGSDEPSRKPPGVTLVKSHDIAAIEALADDKAWNGVHAFNKKAAQSGLLYDRAWARLQRQLSGNRTLAKTHAQAAKEATSQVQGGLHPVTRADGTSFVPDIAALPVVARRVTVVEVDPADLPLSSALRLFMMADVVVGVHGAGLANTLFSPPSTSVVEIAMHQGSFRQYAARSAAMGHDYWVHLPPFTDDFANAVPGDAHKTGVVNRAESESAGLNEHMWGLLRDDPAAIRPSAYGTAVTVQEAPLRGTMAAMLAKRARTNVQAGERAVAAREELLTRGVLPVKYNK